MAKPYTRPSSYDFFQKRVSNCPLKNQKSITFDSDDDEEADTQDPTKTLKYNTVRGYKTAMIDLYHSQTARGQHYHPHPNGSALHALMNNLRGSSPRNHY